MKAKINASSAAVGCFSILTSAHQMVQNEVMRTTLDIEDDVLSVAKHLAQERQQSLGRVVSDLVRRGLQPAVQASVYAGAIPVLARKPGARPVTAQAVSELLEAELFEVAP